MQSLTVSSLVFAFIFGGALASMFLRRTLPLEHLGADAKDTVRLAIGLIVTMTGLVLGMLVSSAKTDGGISLGQAAIAAFELSATDGGHYA